jgi:hypothetical protein
MWTESDERNHPEAAYHGLASILLAGFLLLMALPALQLALWLQGMNYPGMDRSQKQIAAYGGYIGVGVVELLCVIAFGAGIRGQVVARRTGEPTALGGVGMLLSLFAIGLWLACGFAWHLQVYQFIR